MKKYIHHSKAKSLQNNASVMELRVQKEMEWLKLIETHMNFTVTQLRKINPALYAWHYRNNQEWLKENPLRISVKTTVNKRFDWEKRDLELLNQVKKAIKKLYVIEKPIYVNKSRVAKEIGQLSLIEKSLEKLPRTKAYLNKNLETREQFQIRRIKWACKKLFLEDENYVIEWKVRRSSGLRKELSSTVEVYLKNEIRLYQQGEMQIETKTMDI